MEMKLTRAAALLPEAGLEFAAIETAARAMTLPRRRPVRILRFALAIILVAGLTTTAYAYGKIKYGLWSGMSSHTFADVTLLSWQYDYEFPETLGGSPFVSVDINYAAPQGASHPEALLMPTYRLCSIDYGVEMHEEREGVLHTWTANWVRISFGTTKEENWKYHFSVAEDGSCNYGGVIPDSRRTVEYEGYTLHLYAIGETRSVRWEDEERKIVIDITCWDAEDQNHVVEIAKELILLNR